ncbi:hypothetical protein C8J56DRAFT_912438 [Mycena floridula]|nr:hypothetical protein C8J56DRAFT_912438 [Mycena floridula]
MSSTSLPTYIAPSLHHTIPRYTAEPQEYERRIALTERTRPRPTGDFVKLSKSGDAKLRLFAQEDRISLPVYGQGASVEGVVELLKIDGITSVEVKIEGRLKLQEIAEGGTTVVKLCLNTALLWIRDPSNHVCPSSLRFRLSLPTTFTYERKTYMLPPTYEVKLDGLPGFNASIDYSVSAVINKPNSVPSLVPLVKSSLFGINIGNTTVTTPFVYYPRTRPAVPMPSPLRRAHHGFHSDRTDWKVYESSIRCKAAGGQDIVTKLYIPASRIFCMSRPIPFHLTLQSSAHSLAVFLPYGPMANLLGKRPTRIQLMRQATVDVRNELILGTKTDIWRVDCIGEGSFRHAGDGASWVSFSGEINLSDVKVGGFKAGGLTVKDCILLSMSPTDPQRSPFLELRQVVPIRLTTDDWAPDGPGLRRIRAPSQESVPSSSEG